MNWRSLIGRFQTLRSQSQPMVLATVVHTAGSTYTKPGSHMLFDATGEFQGLLSGGCLEGDLAAHAATVMSNREPRYVSYDMRDRDADELWGLGLGCDGQMHILLQIVDSQNNYEPFASLANSVLDNVPAVLALTCKSSEPGLTGSAALISTATVASSGMPAALIDIVTGVARAGAASQRHVQNLRHNIGNETVDILYAPVTLPVRMLVLGAGPDVVPLLNIAIEMGWHITIADHRESYLNAPAFALADQTELLTPATLAEKLLQPNHYDAAIVMSHNLNTDRGYLAALIDTDIEYLGLLGPAPRKLKLLQDIGATADTVRRVHGPVGLDIGASGPETIALSIVAEITQHRSKRHDA